MHGRGENNAVGTGGEEKKACLHGLDWTYYYRRRVVSTRLGRGVYTVVVHSLQNSVSSLPSDGDAGGTPVEPTFNAPLLPPLRPPLSKKIKEAEGRTEEKLLSLFPSLLPAASSLSFSWGRGGSSDGEKKTTRTSVPM